MEDKSQHIGNRMRYFNHCIRQLISSASKEREEAYGMSMMDGWILRYLAEHEDREVFQKNIEMDLHIKKSALTQELNEMESKGLIRRSISPHDSRYKCIARTQKALEIHQQIMDEMAEHERLIKKGISPEDLAVFSRVLDTMISNVSTKQPPVRSPEWLCGSKKEEGKC